MIRAVLIAALLLLPAVARAKPAPGPAKRHGFTLQLPDVPVVPPIPEIEFPDVDFDVDLGDLDFGGMVARNDRDPDGEEEDRDEDRRERDRERRERDRERQQDDQDAETRDGARIYKMDPARNFRSLGMPRVHVGENDAEDGRDATAKAKGRGSATLPVRGPVTFQIHVQSGDLEVVSTDKQQVSVTLTDVPADDVALYAYGDRVEPSFRGRRTLKRGNLRVELPRGSRLDLSSMSGGVTAQRIGDVRIRTMSGDVKLIGVAKAEVQTISGDTRIEDAAGPVRLHTVSGKAVVSTTGTAPQVEFQSASGSLDWTGVCAKDCHLTAETVSGEVRLAVDPKSSFELSYSSHSGELRDEMNLAVKRSPRRKAGLMTSGWIEATYGRGEGVIEADAFSGNVTVRRR